SVDCTGGVIAFQMSRAVTCSAGCSPSNVPDTAGWGSATNSPEAVEPHTPGSLFLRSAVSSPELNPELFRMALGLTPSGWSGPGTTTACTASMVARGLMYGSIWE